MDVTVEDIHNMWAIDGPIDHKNLHSESSNIAYLHNKYYKLYAECGLALRKKRVALKALNRAKTQWYSGYMTPEDLKIYGWKPNPLKIAKVDVPGHLDVDDDIIRGTLDLGNAEVVVDYLESILAMISKRSYNIGNMIAFEKLRNGM